MTRDEHLAWCKRRAHEELEAGGDPIASMCSDIQKHPETEMKSGMLATLMMAAMMDAGNPTAIKRWIDGFN